MTVAGSVRPVGQRIVAAGRSRWARLALAAGSGLLLIPLGLLAGRYFTETPWPLSKGHPALLAGAGLLVLLTFVLKPHGWRRLFAVGERPKSVALAAATGGASVSGVALPGRFDDVVRVAIVRRFPGCPAGVRTLCLSLVMLGLIDAAALAPLALTAAVFPSAAPVRAVVVLVAVAGVGAAAVLLLLPRVTASSRVLRFRLGRWLGPRTVSPGSVVGAWLLVSASWLSRAFALYLLLGALGIGFSIPLALMFLSASAAAAAIPVGPAGAVTQAGAGAAVLIASGVDPTAAAGIAVAAQTLAVLSGALVLLFTALWHTVTRLGRTAGACATLAVADPIRG